MLYVVIGSVVAMASILASIVAVCYDPPVALVFVVVGLCAAILFCNLAEERPSNPLAP